MSQRKRQSDPNHDLQWKRSAKRVFHRAGDWFFSSREGDMGPFESEREAMEELETYVMLVDLKEENERPVTPDVPEDQRVF